MPEKILVYVGTYANAESDGIHIYRLDAESGALEAVGAVSGLHNPSFLAIHPNGRSLYAVNEVGEFNGKRGGAVAAFSLASDTGALTLLNRQSSVGQGPCHISVDATGKVALVANYGSGSVTALPIQEDGSLGESSSFVQHTGSGANPSRQEAPHAHSIYPDPGNRFAFSPDLGLDRVMSYRLSTRNGTLTPNDPPYAETHAGAGPRHFAFHPGGKWGYVINELDSTVIAYAYDGERGSLEAFQTISTVPEGTTETNYTADIHVHPNGKFLYGSNRGHDSIVIYGIDRSTGQLNLIGHESTQGKWPRNFALDPSGTFLYAANQNTDNIVIFRVDAETGELTATGQMVLVPKPVCVAMRVM